MLRQVGGVMAALRRGGTSTARVETTALRGALVGPIGVRWWPDPAIAFRRGDESPAVHAQPTG